MSPLERWEWLSAILDQYGHSTTYTVAGALGRYVNADSGKAWPSLSRLAKDARLHRSTVCRALMRLERGGFLSRQSGGPTFSTVYTPKSYPQGSRTSATRVGAPVRLGSRTGVREVVAPVRHEQGKEQEDARARAHEARPHVAEDGVDLTHLRQGPTTAGRAALAALKTSGMLKSRQGSAGCLEELEDAAE